MRIAGRCGGASPGTTSDTIVWYLGRDSLLSAKAEAVLDAVEQSRDWIWVPSICLVELTYLEEKGRLPASARARLIGMLENDESPCRLAPLDRRVADALESVKRTDVPDLPDRIIAATAVALGVPLVTRDGKIRASQVETIW